MDPYLRGNRIQMLREAYKPKDLIVPPDSLYVSDYLAWITEYTLIKLRVGWPSGLTMFYGIISLLSTRVFSSNTSWMLLSLQGT